MFIVYTANWGTRSTTTTDALNNSGGSYEIVPLDKSMEHMCVGGDKGVEGKGSGLSCRLSKKWQAY